jgi:hypothetical protein
LHGCRAAMIYRKLGLAGATVFLLFSDIPLLVICRR